MKFLIKKIYIILFLILIILRSNVFAKDANFQYNRENVSNYFFGVVLLNQDNNKEAFKHLKKVKSLKDKHSKYNVEFTRTLILLEKFNEAFSFSKNIWREEEFLFETDLLLGLESLTNHNYITAEKHFKRLNKISKYNPFFGNFLGNVLLAWNKAAEGKEDERYTKNYIHQTHRFVQLSSATTFLHHTITLSVILGMVIHNPLYFEHWGCRLFILNNYKGYWFAHIYWAFSGLIGLGFVGFWSNLLLGARGMKMSA